jgi:hypothetical protein
MMTFGISHTFAAAALLLAVSFFVLQAVCKAETKGGLKTFGWVVTALLWAATLGVLCGPLCHKQPRPGMMPGAWGGPGMNQQMGGPQQGAPQGPQSGWARHGIWKNRPGQTGQQQAPAPAENPGQGSTNK